MEILKLEKAGSSFAPVSVDGTKITIGVHGNSVTIDAAEEERMEQAVIDVYTHGASSAITKDADDISGGVFNVATIVIPPAKTELVDAGTKVNETTGKEETVVEIERFPLDIDAVRVTLWPLPFAVEAPKAEEKEEATEEAAEAAAETKEEN